MALFKKDVFGNSLFIKKTLIRILGLFSQPNLANYLYALCATQLKMAEDGAGFIFLHRARESTG